MKEGRFNILCDILESLKNNDFLSEILSDISSCLSLSFDDFNKGGHHIKEGEDDTVCDLNRFVTVYGEGRQQIMRYLN